jgi:hypothetical protein
LALQLDSKTAKTSFGRLPLSDETSNPVFGFTQAKREENTKMFLGDVTKNFNIAKHSPGPIYRFEDEVKYQKVSGRIYSISKLQMNRAVRFNTKFL